MAGEEDLVKCAHKAYDESLKKYHGWIVSGIFSVRTPNCGLTHTYRVTTDCGVRCASHTHAWRLRHV